MRHEFKIKNIVWLDLPLQQQIIEQAKKYDLAVNVYIAKVLEFAMQDKDFLNKINEGLKVFTNKPINPTTEKNKWQAIIQYINMLKDKGIIKHSKIQMVLKLGLDEEDFKKMKEHGLIENFDSEWIYLE